jgi:rhomboid family GlyGly-CTERM serine protease
MGFREDHKTMLAVSAVAALALLFQLGGEPLRTAFAWDRGALGQGEVWRLATGHFVHLGWSHLVLNIAGLGLVTWITGKTFSVLRWLVIAVLTLAVIDAGFWYLYDGLDWYVGLSGLLHGLLVAGLFAGTIRGDREAMALGVLVIGKLAWEQVAGPLPGSESTSGGAVIVDAHLYGAVGGLLGALIPWRSVRSIASI